MTFYFSYFLLVSTCVLVSLAESNYFAFVFGVINYDLYPFGKGYNS